MNDNDRNRSIYLVTDEFTGSERPITCIYKIAVNLSDATCLERKWHQRPQSYIASVQRNVSSLSPPRLPTVSMDVDHPPDALMNVDVDPIATHSDGDEDDRSEEEVNQELRLDTNVSDTESSTDGMDDLPADLATRTESMGPELGRHGEGSSPASSQGGQDVDLESQSDEVCIVVLHCPHMSDDGPVNSLLHHPRGYPALHLPPQKTPNLVLTALRHNPRIWQVWRRDLTPMKYAQLSSITQSSP